MSDTYKNKYELSTKLIDSLQDKKVEITFNEFSAYTNDGRGEKRFLIRGYTNEFDLGDNTKHSLRVVGRLNLNVIDAKLEKHIFGAEKDIDKRLKSLIGKKIETKIFRFKPRVNKLYFNTSIEDFNFIK